MKKENKTFFYKLDIQYFSAKKGMGSSKNGRDTIGRRLGVKKTDGEKTTIGAILYRQRGTKVHPGKNVGMGKDNTLFAKVSGTVKWTRGGHKNRVFVNVEADNK